MNLMYSAANDTLMTRQEIATLDTPEALGRFHHPYPFSDYINDVTRALVSHDINISKEELIADILSDLTVPAED